MHSFADSKSGAESRERPENSPEFFVELQPDQQKTCGHISINGSKEEGSGAPAHFRRGGLLQGDEGEDTAHSESRVSGGLEIFVEIDDQPGGLQKRAQNKQGRSDFLEFRVLKTKKSHNETDDPGTERDNDAAQGA